MGVNLVGLSNGETVVDLRQDTINPDVVLEGYTGHDAQGEQFEGRLKAGGTAEQEVMIVTADFSFLSLKVSNLSPSYSEIHTALVDQNKIVKIAVSYVLPGETTTNTAIGEVTAIILSENTIQFGLFVRAKLGTEFEMYYFTIFLHSSGSVGTDIRLIESSSVGG